jgi:hypothetical protein
MKNLDTRCIANGRPGFHAAERGSEHWLFLGQAEQRLASDETSS